MAIDLPVLIRQLASFLIMVGIGFLAVRFRFIADSVHEALSALVMHLTMPALLLTCYIGMDLVGNPLVPMTLLGTLLLFVIQVLLGGSAAFGMGLRKDRLGAHLYCSCFGSVGYFALPLLGALFGKDGLLATSLFLVMDSVLTWTFGMWFTGCYAAGATQGESKAQRTKRILKGVFNPAFLATLTGLGLSFLPIDPNSVAVDAVSAIGACSSPLAMLCIGGNLAKSGLSGLKNNWRAITLPVTKMFLGPIACYLLLSTIGFSKEAAMYIALIAAAPTSSTGAILCKENGSKSVDYCSIAVVVTVCMSIIAIPLVGTCINWLGR